MKHSEKRRAPIQLSATAIVRCAALLLRLLLALCVFVSVLYMCCCLFCAYSVCIPEGTDRGNICRFGVMSDGGLVLAQKQFTMQFPVKFRSHYFVLSRFDILTNTYSTCMRECSAYTYGLLFYFSFLLIPERTESTSVYQL